MNKEFIFIDGQCVEFELVHGEVDYIIGWEDKKFIKITDLPPAAHYPLNIKDPVSRRRTWVNRVFKDKCKVAFQDYVVDDCFIEDGKLLTEAEEFAIWVREDLMDNEMQYAYCGVHNTALWAMEKAYEVMISIKFPKDIDEYNKAVKTLVDAFDNLGTTLQ